jgi:hypothetical protein
VLDSSAHRVVVTSLPYGRSSFRGINQSGKFHPGVSLLGVPLQPGIFRSCQRVRRLDLSKFSDRSYSRPPLTWRGSKGRLELLVPNPEGEARPPEGRAWETLPRPVGIADEVASEPDTLLFVGDGKILPPFILVQLRGLRYPRRGSARP